MAERKSQICRLLMAGIFAVGLAASSVPALAQFGQIFGAPPRPPANVPSRPPAPLGLPEQMPPEEMDEEIQPPPLRGGPPPGVRGPGAVRSQPLAPPPGVAVAPPGATLPQGPPGQFPPDDAPQPGDEVITELPSQKIANPMAVFAGLDKITGRIIAFDVALNEKVQFGALQVTPRVCYTRPPTETANTDSFVEVDEVTLQGEVKRIFTGWMFAASPGLHAVEHPIYDIWLTDCKGGATVVSDAQTSAPVSAPGQRIPTPRPSSAGQRPPSQQLQRGPQQQQAPAMPPPFGGPRR